MPTLKIPTCLIALLCVSLLGACEHTEKPPSDPEAPYTQPVERKAAPHLEQDYAAMRAQQLRDVSYRLSVVLNDESDAFTGSLQTDFTLAEGNGADLTIDFNGGTVERLRLNGEDISWDYNGWFITLAADRLPAGENTLTIDYRRPYATDGDGLHRYIDPETGNQYLYTNFQPYNTNKLFPHFDQPNIKAPFTLDVVAPVDWEVISATREERVQERDDTRHWHFPETAPMPSYIFPLHAGPYHYWEETYSDGDYRVPMRLYARREIREHVVPEDWFTYTRQSFEFFNDYFHEPYMFGKYDQLIVPDFNAGAMENLAAVTFTERFVSRGPKVEAEKVRLANVISHELAHMWFGNLVTLNWWDGLWLNESFATYMAYLQLARHSDFDNTWDIFYSRTKQWAYETDQQVTTHPIELPVPTTADAFTNFDGITYGKGASVLKQLPYYLGEENFRRGVANYLQEHAYANTELEDFIGALAESADRDLSQWTDEWLHRPSLNTLSTEFSCADGELATLTLRQSAPEEHPTLRSQRVQLGLFAGGETAKLVQRLPVTYAGAETEVDIPDQTPCPDLVYPNLDDWGYVKVLLDEQSQRTLESDIHQFADDSLRIMLWQSLWDRVRDVALPVTDFVRFATAQLPAENNNRIISLVADQLVDSNSYLWQMDPEGVRYPQELDVIAGLFWERLQAAAPGSDQQRIWFSEWLRVASSPSDLDRAQALLRETTSIEGLSLDQDLRWGLVLLVNRHAYGDYRALTEAESTRDPSERGQQNALGVEASRPSAQVKEKWLEEIVQPDSDYKLSQLRTVMEKLFPVHQVELLDQYADRILTALPALVEQREDRFVSLYARYLLPATCSADSVQRLEDAIDKHSGLNPSLDKALKIARQENQRCVDMKQLSLR